MKNYALSLIFILLAVIFSAHGLIIFKKHRESPVSLKKYVAVAVMNGKYYLANSPSNPEGPYQVPLDWDEGVDYVCLSSSYNDVCTVSVTSYTDPVFDVITECYYFDSDDVICLEWGVFFAI